MAMARLGVTLAALVWLGACSEDGKCDGNKEYPSCSALDEGDGGQDAGGPDGGGEADAAVALNFDEFDSVIDQFLTEKMLAGATVAVVHKTRGIVHERGYGSFNKGRISLIASSSKILSVGVLMALADAGKLDLDKPVSGYLQAWGNHKTDITTAMLVSNSSGLVSLTQNPYYAPYICQYTEGGDLKSCSQTIYSAADEADRVPVDSMFKYGGGQWQLAGGVAEVVSGKSWADLIKETYVTPCGVASLGYTNQFQKAAGTGYPMFFTGDVATLPVTQNPSIEGGAYVSAGDYAKLLQMHLRGGLCGDQRVLSEAAVERMQADRIKEKYNGSTPSAAMAGYGLGWWIDRDHPGVVVDPGAYGAVAWLDKQHEYGGFVVLEATSAVGTELFAKLKPVADAVFDD
ncbi:MAG TPA: serine hydrolase domain-containing protein [Polyangiales bacterium]